VGRTLGAALAVALSVVGWWRGMEAGPRVRTEGGLCRGLPSAGRAVAELPPRAVLRLAVDPRDPRAGARFVCAQLEVAPRVLLGPPEVDRRARGPVEWSLVETEGRLVAVPGDLLAPGPEPLR
jgi:hypothetical protein